METTVDRFGRVVIPKRVRDDLGLHPGTVLRVEERGGAVRLSALHEEESLVEEDGVLVFRGRAEGDLVSVAEKLREARLDDVVASLLP